ncbi:ATP-binding protein, partial [Xanthovirga aplysinae]|uniref:ATP-binding protein n=1 Tax=Xanthovirga aplysinae TaxID=2529853 RepID=UPI00165749D1
GNKGNKSKNVVLSLNVDDSSVRFIVEDKGDGFEYDKLPDPTAPQNIDKPGGRGIFLMKHLADEVHFKNNGSLVELNFYIN